MAKRIQLRRIKGWRLPLGAMSVARPGPFGNPFTFSAANEAGQTREGAVAAFEDWLAGNPWACPANDTYETRRQVILSRISELRGKDLACWCPLDKACHADVLLRLANGEGET